MRSMRWMRAGRAWCVAMLVMIGGAGSARAQSAPAQATAAADAWSRVPKSVRAATEEITPDSLKGDLSFIASDLLEGRDTPSRGLDLAAYYIAAQFRGAGLEPVGDDGYFQSAHWELRVRRASAFSGQIKAGDTVLGLSYDQMSIAGDEQVDLRGARLVRIAGDQPQAVDSMDAEALKGAVVLTDLPNFRTAPREARREAYAAMQALLPKLQAAGVAAVISLDRTGSQASGFGNGELVDPERPARRGRGGGSGTPLLWSHDPAVAALCDSLGNGPADGSVNLVLKAPQDEPVTLRNVIGMLPGSDPELRDEYVIVTAHYDHLGTGAEVDGDHIYNGANDDGSGTVSVMALARALASLPEQDRPRRSMLFMTVFGEEKGLLGSSYYVRHPIFPLARTVGDVNLEQIGRTDSTEGPQVNRASLTGFAYSTLTDAFVQAGQAVGIEVYNHPQNSEAFFDRSDNRAFALAGVPAHTLCVAYEYPDYHGLADHWEKVDYENLARVDRMVALGLYLIADNEQAPAWNTDHPGTERYVEAALRLQAPAEP